MKKKLLLACLTVLAFCTFGLTACSNQPASTGGLEYALSSDGTTYECVGIGSATDSNLTIASTYEGKPVTAIKDEAFAYNNSLKKVTIPSSIEKIGKNAFLGCNNLEYNYSNGGLYLGNGSNKYYAFIGLADTVISTFTMSEKTEIIAVGALNNKTDLQFVNLGKNLKTIDDDVLSGCISVKELAIPCLTGEIASKDAFDYSKYFGDTSTESFEKFTLYGKTQNSFITTGSNSTLVVGDNFTEIQEGDYSSSASMPSAQTVIIGDSVTSIGDYAFDGCDLLQSVTMGNSVTSIGDWAFDDCTSLQSVTIGNGVTSIGIRAFSGCTSLQYNVYGNAKYLGNAENPYVALIRSVNDEITSCEIHSDTKVIHSDAFDGCDLLQSVTMGNSVTSIGDWAFYDCTSLERVEYTGKIDQWAMIDFVHSSSNPLRYAEHLYLYNETSGEFEEVTEVNLTTATKISDYAFTKAQSITKVTIGDGVTSIEYFAFEDCTSLQSVTIGNGVTSIETSAFIGCYKLVEVINKSSLTIEKGYSYSGDVGYYALCVLNEQPTPSNFVTEGDYTFYKYEDKYYLINYTGSQTELTLPESVDGDNSYEIYKYAFYRNGKITSVIISDGVTSIGSYAFYDCNSLQSVTIGNGVTSIGNHAFSSCDSLQSVTIGNGVTSIGGYAFSSCDSLQSIVIPDSVTSIGYYAFYACDSLTSVTFKDTSTWYYTSNSSYTGGTQIDVTNSSTNATNLRSTHYRYYRYKG